MTKPRSRLAFQQLGAGKDGLAQLLHVHIQQGEAVDKAIGKAAGVDAVAAGVQHPFALGVAVDQLALVKQVGPLVIADPAADLAGRENALHAGAALQVEGSVAMVQPLGKAAVYSTVPS